MKKKILMMLTVCCFLCIGLVSPSFAADVPMQWQPEATADGYKIQMSTDMGVTWTPGLDVGNVTEYTLIGVQDTGYVLFRALAYNQNGEGVNYRAGAWYCGDCSGPPAPTSATLPGVR